MSGLTEKLEEGAQGLGGGGGSNEQSSMGDQQQGGGNQNTEDKYLNEGVDKVASEEGVPGMADGALNKEVDQEANKLM